MRIADVALPFTDEELDGFRKAVADKPESGGYQRLLATIDDLKSQRDRRARAKGRRARRLTARARNR